MKSKKNFDTINKYKLELTEEELTVLYFFLRQIEFDFTLNEDIILTSIQSKIMNILLKANKFYGKKIDSIIYDDL